jgi:ABC-type molybdenum transport system ATPase subunit/photorepair protein PhrA
MRTHVDNVHPHLLAKRDFVLSERVVVKVSEIYHRRQHEKKKVRVINFVITSFFGSINMYKNVDEAQQRFIQDLVLYICKATCFFQCLKTFG